MEAGMDAERALQGFQQHGARSLRVSRAALVVASVFFGLAVTLMGENPYSLWWQVVLSAALFGGMWGGMMWLFFHWWFLSHLKRIRELSVVHPATVISVGPRNRIVVELEGGEQLGWSSSRKLRFLEPRRQVWVATPHDTAARFL